MLIGAVPPPPAIQELAPPAAFGFENALLGETVADWRAAAGPRVSCPSVTRRSGAMTCTAPPVALGGRQLAHDITYEFIGGRLARIHFLTSIDAYDRVRARLDGRFGAPRDIVRDNIQIDQSIETPHLKAYWRNGRSTILLNDPEGDGRSLSVTYSLDAMSSGLPHPAS